MTEKKRGRLIVFEGADGVGKSTLCTELGARFFTVGHPFVHISFPGREPGTLGNLVYGIHHAPESAGIKTKIVPAGVQALHVSAHIDSIERSVFPALANGATVLLDRFWWSTEVYGAESGVDDSLLNSILHLARTAWKNVTPDIVFLLERKSNVSNMRVLSDRYLQIAARETKHYPVKLIDNSEGVEATLEKIIDYLSSTDAACNGLKKFEGNL